MIVLDASVLANLVGDDGTDGATARARLLGAGEGAIPDLGDVQSVAVLRKRWIARTRSDERFAAAVSDIAHCVP